MSKIDINICSCTGDCEDLKILDTNKKDDTKENLLEVVENEDLLEIETGVPFTKKTKVKPKRDTTKLNIKDFEEYKKFNEDILNNRFNIVNKDIKDLKNKDDILSEAITKKANISDLDKKADKTELDKKADKTELDKKADKSSLDLKADKTELDKKADKTELDKKADISDLDSFENTLTEYGKLLDDKIDFDGINSFNFINKNQLLKLKSELTGITNKLKEDKINRSELNVELSKLKNELDNIYAGKSGYSELRSELNSVKYKVNNELADKTELDKKADKSELDDIRNNLGSKIDKNYLKFIVNNEGKTWFKLEGEGKVLEGSLTRDTTFIRVLRERYIIEKYNKDDNIYKEPTIIDFSRVEDGNLEVFFGRNFNGKILEMETKLDTTDNKIVLSNFEWLSNL